jgi:hypothetical protein
MRLQGGTESPLDFEEQSDLLGSQWFLGLLVATWLSLSSLPYLICGLRAAAVVTSG